MNTLGISVAVFRSLTIATVALVLTVGQAQAQVKPFKISGSGVAPNGIALIPGTPAPHSASGQANELGSYFGEGSFKLLNYTGPTTAAFASAEPFVFVAPNGDELAFTYGDTANGALQPGSLTLFPAAGGSFIAVFVAEFNPEPALSTGRFAKIVDGSVTMVWTTDPFFITGNTTTPFAYTWTGSGSLEFEKGK